MDEQTYLKDRVDDQIQWYDKKSTQNQIWYKFLRTTEIVLSILIPFLTGLLSINLITKLTIGFFGVIIAIIAGVLSLYKFQENWLHYRTTSEALKHEKYLFVTWSGIYNEDDRFSVFVEKIENIISKENLSWYEYVKKDKTVIKEKKNS